MHLSRPIHRIVSTSRPNSACLVAPMSEEHRNTAKPDTSCNFHAY